ncbi:NCS1 family nucleobase:cation symporter-1 [Pseudactinotalea sp. HY160]|uniref:NCS1 family nucleobase:cation symporter-1 n=1 Tax=Pseudactinotalea sp. HY160 TaxID=2654490 RepID=UPI00128BE48E|nr:NCS1 family nucleobase:cation symporter-1 [Pseudactinotalea sp. HY160]MPV50341.1 NCS1 family nucleobase:cation symporter-1 [Pseudactinotalea sp. HY160]
MRDDNDRGQGSARAAGPAGADGPGGPGESAPSDRTHPGIDVSTGPPRHHAGPEPWGTGAPEQQRAPHDPQPSHPAPAGTSPALYNRDLAPTTRSGRTWHAYSIFTLWANDAHSLGNYTFAIGLFALGLGGWQILLAFLIASGLLFVLLSISGIMGERTGVPFPVMSRISFGVVGAKVPAAVRGVVAIAWFGIQTYLAAVVLKVLIIALYEPAAKLDESTFLGLSPLGWIAFVALWILQVLIVIRGMEMIRKYEAFAGPIILVTFLALAIWVFTKALSAGITIDWSPALTAAGDPAPTGGAMWLDIGKAAALWVVIYGTFVLNFCDFTRGAPHQKAVLKGNFFGIPINMMFFAVIVVALSASEFSINGTFIESPSDVVEQIPNTLLLALASLALIILTIAVNLMANFVAPIYMFANFFPKHLNFKRAAIITAIIGLIILPWNLYNSPAVIEYFLGGLGALLGPIFGVIIVDYWVVRRGRINVPDLYSQDPKGEYAYTRGTNLKAVAAGAPAAAVALIVALVPFFEGIAGFSWFIGAILAAAIFWIIADHHKDYHDVDGEAIAVPPLH